MTRLAIVLTAALVGISSLGLAQTGADRRQHPEGMHQGPMGQESTGPGTAPGMPARGADRTEAAKDYMDAMAKMNRGTPMDSTGDADVDFVRMMIPHHRGAVDMAKVVQKHGKDEQVRKWAAEIIRSQEREIAEMSDWLKKHGH